MKAVVFSGTTEGRRFSKKLAELGAAVTVCVATPSSASFLEKRRPSVVPLNTTAFTYGTPAA